MSNSGNLPICPKKQNKCRSEINNKKDERKQTKKVSIVRKVEVEVEEGDNNKMEKKMGTGGEETEEERENEKK